MCPKKQQLKVKQLFFLFFMTGDGGGGTPTPTHGGEACWFYCRTSSCCEHSAHTASAAGCDEGDFFQDEAYGVIDLVPCAGLTALAG